MVSIKPVSYTHLDVYKRQEYVRVPFADQGLNKIPDGVTDRQALLVGDVLATGFWAARISEITPCLLYTS